MTKSRRFNKPGDCINILGCHNIYDRNNLVSQAYYKVH